MSQKNHIKNLMAYNVVKASLESIQETTTSLATIAGVLAGLSFAVFVFYIQAPKDYSNLLNITIAILLIISSVLFIKSTITNTNTALKVGQFRKFSASIEQTATTLGIFDETLMGKLGEEGNNLRIKVAPVWILDTVLHYIGLFLMFITITLIAFTLNLILGLVALISIFFILGYNLKRARKRLIFPTIDLNIELSREYEELWDDLLKIMEKTIEKS